LNFPTISSLPVSVFSAGAGGAGNQPIGFPVDSAGYIAMPIIGKQKVEGLTIESAEIKLRTELEKTLKEPSVNVRFMNHKFSVLGEVGNIGTFNLLDDQTTILDALIAAGDLSEYAKRDSVMVIRNKNGMREIGRVNFRTREVFTSPYFYLQNGDIIYVEPTKDKTLPPKPILSANTQRVVTYLGVVTGLLSIIILLIRL
jgi:polysaccharide biosynthesis/export protein